MATAAVSYSLHVATTPDEAKPVSQESHQVDNSSKAFSAAQNVPNEYILDDSDSGFFIANSGWKISKNKIGFKNGYRFNSKGALRARWQFSGLHPGSYAVFITWPNVPENACHLAFVEISDSTGLLLDCQIDQSVEPQGEVSSGVIWQKLGDVNVLDGMLFVDIDPARSRDGTARVDAVRIVRLESRASQKIKRKDDR